MVENFDEFDERLAIRQNFSYQSSSLNASPLKPTSNSSKFCEWFICQSFPLSNFCTIRYTILNKPIYSITKST